MTVTLESIALPTAIAPGMATYRIDGGPEPVRVVQPFRRGPPHYENGRPMWGWARAGDAHAVVRCPHEGMAPALLPGRRADPALCRFDRENMTRSKIFRLSC